MKISEEAVKQTVVTISRDEFVDVLKDTSCKFVREFADNGEDIIALTLMTAMLSAKIERAIFNNKEEK